MQNKSLEECSDEELIREAKVLYWEVNVLNCYKEIPRYSHVVGILEDRGYREVPSVEFIKDEEIGEEEEEFSVPKPGDTDYIGEEVG